MTIAAPIPNATYRTICGLVGTVEVLALAGFVTADTSAHRSQRQEDKNDYILFVSQTNTSQDGII
jgi:hypothetical protein